MGDEVDLQGVTIRPDRNERKTLPKRKESMNIAPTYATLLDVFARTNIINQIGVYVPVIPRIALRAILSRPGLALSELDSAGHLHFDLLGTLSPFGHHMNAGWGVV